MERYDSWSIVMHDWLDGVYLSSSGHLDTNHAILCLLLYHFLSTVSFPEVSAGWPIPHKWLMVWWYSRHIGPRIKRDGWPAITDQSRRPFWKIASGAGIEPWILPRRLEASSSCSQESRRRFPIWLPCLVNRSRWNLSTCNFVFLWMNNLPEEAPLLSPGGLTTVKSISEQSVFK